MKQETVEILKEKMKQKLQAEVNIMKEKMKEYEQKLQTKVNIMKQEVEIVREKIKKEYEQQLQTKVDIMKQETVEILREKMKKEYKQKLQTKVNIMKEKIQAEVEITQKKEYEQKLQTEVNIMKQESKKVASKFEKLTEELKINASLLKEKYIKNISKDIDDKIEIYREKITKEYEQKLHTELVSIYKENKKVETPINDVLLDYKIQKYINKFSELKLSERDNELKIWYDRFNKKAKEHLKESMKQLILTYKQYSGLKLTRDIIIEYYNFFTTNNNDWVQKMMEKLKKGGNISNYRVYDEANSNSRNYYIDSVNKKNNMFKNDFTDLP